ncbi:MAG: methyltransferase domain-containing protein [Pirellula sp.]|jgi:ubiquinone/menaquinone biosynthesis C-methylase UbiE|nr:methyltransferase domain-containing protein [Pirellula sp.]
MSKLDIVHSRSERRKHYRAFFALQFMVFSLVLLGTVTTTAMAQREANTKKETPPKPLTTYMGRRIALTMSYHGIPWLNRSERIDEERPAELLEQLKLKDGMVVCDMGCGDGYHAFQMAPMVGPSGKVIAVDIQPEMLQELSRKMKQTEIHNIDTVLGELWDPKLDAESVDLLLMVDVYHEFAYPVQMLSAIRKSLKSDGLVALVEFRAEDPTVPIKPEHKMSKAQAKKEFKKNGFKLVREYDKLPWQHVMFFARDESHVEAGDETKN